MSGGSQEGAQSDSDYVEESTDDPDTYSTDDTDSDSTDNFDSTPLCKHQLTRL